jgi:hypothetical protein
MALRVSRRAFLAVPLPLMLFPRAISAAFPTPQSLDFTVDVGVLFDMVTFALKGTAIKDIDRPAGRYRVTMTGAGEKISLDTVASGVIRQGRFMPVELHSSSTIRGRESKLDLLYDYDRGTVEYHAVNHTFFLGRRRQVDDVLKLPTDRAIDDLLSAELNFAANMLDREPDGTYRTYIVRRARPENEGPGCAAHRLPRRASRCAFGLNSTRRPAVSVPSSTSRDSLPGPAATSRRGSSLGPTGTSRACSRS